MTQTKGYCVPQAKAIARKNPRAGRQRHAGFATMAVSSSSAGVLVNARGWQIVNYTAIPFVTIALIAAL